MVVEMTAPQSPKVPWADDAVWAAIECGPGWFPLLTSLDADLRALCPTYTVAQIKEKFGTLRYYINHLDDVPEDVALAVHTRIAAAEQKSASTCEECGQPGRLCGTAWFRTLCRTCEDVWQRRRATLLGE